MAGFEKILKGEELRVAYRRELSHTTLGVGTLSRTSGTREFHCSSAVLFEVLSIDVVPCIAVCLIYCSTSYTTCGRYERWRGECTTPKIVFVKFRVVILF